VPGLAVHGPTLTLRFATEPDAAALFALAADPGVTRFFSWSYDRVEQAQAWIAGLPAQRAAGERLEFVIEHPERGILGTTGLSEFAHRDRRATVGTWLGRAHWGTGANAESKALIARLAFEHLGLERLTAYTGTTNDRSLAALTRLGFVREGLLRAFHRHGDAVHDVVVLSLLRADWEGSPLHDVAARVEGEPESVFTVR